MSICVYTMARANTVKELGSRLERLTGEDASCCVSAYQDLGKEVARKPLFKTTLERARALADESRLMAVTLLRGQKDLCACEIQAALGVTHATVSHHMRVLADAGLVQEERRGKWMYYRLRDSAGVAIP